MSKSRNFKLKAPYPAGSSSAALRGITTASSPCRLNWKKNRILQVASIIFFSVWCWTLADVADMTNWTLENLPVFALLGTLALTYKYYKFSDLSYMLVFLYLSTHIYGAKFTYALNPFGSWLQEQFHTSRNHYDRIVHFSFGFILSYPARELFLNYFRFSRRMMLGMLLICSLAAGALYEIVEGTVVGIFFPEQGANFLGIQGDIWDPQKDMFLAFAGAVCFGGFICLIKFGQSFLIQQEKNEEDHEKIIPGAAIRKISEK